MSLGASARRHPRQLRVGPPCDDAAGLGRTRCHEREKTAIPHADTLRPPQAGKLTFPHLQPRHAKKEQHETAIAKPTNIHQIATRRLILRRCLAQVQRSPQHTPGAAGRSAWPEELPLASAVPRPHPCAPVHVFVSVFPLRSPIRVIYITTPHTHKRQLPCGTPRIPKNTKQIKKKHPVLRGLQCQLTLGRNSGFLFFD